MSIIQQLEDLKEWSQDSARYERRLNFRAGQAKEKEIKIAGIKDSALYKTLKDPRVIGIDLGHDTIMEVINLIQNSGLVKKPKPEPTIPIEEKINQIAYQRKLAENKLFGLNEEFAKQKLREQMS